MTCVDGMSRVSTSMATTGFFSTSLCRMAIQGRVGSHACALHARWQLLRCHAAVVDGLGVPPQLLHQLLSDRRDFPRRQPGHSYLLLGRREGSFRGLVHEIAHGSPARAVLAPAGSSRQRAGTSGSSPHTSCCPTRARVQAPNSATQAARTEVWACRPDTWRRTSSGIAGCTGGSSRTNSGSQENRNSASCSSHARSAGSPLPHANQHSPLRSPPAVPTHIAPCGLEPSSNEPVTLSVCSPARLAGGARSCCVARHRALIGRGSPRSTT